MTASPSFHSSTKTDIDTVMKFLRCKLCRGEVDIVGNDRSINKKTKCTKCGFAGGGVEPQGPEVVIIRRRSNFSGEF